MQEEQFSPMAMHHKRWYDQEPLLAKALEELRQASTIYQAQIALNIMKVIIEHRAEAALSEPAEQLSAALDVLQPNASHRRRWYDADQTLQAAMQLLQDTPEDLQATLLPNIAQMIETSLQKNLQSASI